MNLIGLDVGTSGVKVLVLDTDGRIRANVMESYPSDSPRPLWSEQDPEVWWKASCRAIKRAIKEARVPTSSVGAIGLSGQMVGLTVLDKSGNVIRPCILWNDQRSVAETESLTETIGMNTILSETGNPLFATFVAPKLVWMRNHEPGHYARIAHVLMPKDHIAYRMTGNISTEVSDASGTCLFNVRERKWSRRMIQAMHIPKSWLPTCLESEDMAGNITSQAAEQCGLEKGTPVIAGAGDQPAQALGSGIVSPGKCSVTIGTSGVVFAQGDTFLPHPTGLLHAFCHAVRDQWYLMGVMLSAGGSFQWLHSLVNQAGEMDYDALTVHAKKVSPGSEGLIFLPYLSGERVPYDDPRARGAWIGLTTRHKLLHLVRAVMEGITFGLLDSLNLIEDLGLSVDKIHASGGAVRSELWLQMLADVFQKEILTTSVSEGAAYGAAMLAGIGIREYTGAAEAASALVKITRSFHPNKEESLIYQDYYEIYRSLYPLLKDQFSSLTDLSVKDQPVSS